MKPNRKYLLLAASAAITVAFSAQSAHAQIFWDSDGVTPGFGSTTGVWGTDAFWSASSAGTAATANTTTTTTSIVQFGTATLNYNNAAVGVAAGGVTVNDIIFGSTTGDPITAGQTTAVNVGTAGNSITLGGASPTIVSNSTGHRISSPIILNPSSGGTTISFGRSLPATGSFTLSGGISGTGDVTFTTPSVASNGNLQSINLGAAATYSGTTTIGSGNAANSMAVANTSGAANVLPIGTVLTFANNVGNGTGRTLTFNLNGRNQTLAGLTQPTNIPNDRNYRVSSTSAATLTIDNSVDSSFGGTNIDVGASTPGTVTTAQITGAISLVKEGAGIFTLGGNLTNGATSQSHTYTGTTTVNAGTLRINTLMTGTGAMFVNGGNLTIGNYDALDNTSGITVSGGTAALQLAQVGTGTTTNSTDRAVSLHGFMRITGGSATNRLNQTWAGNITLAGNSTITNNGNSLWDIDGQINLGANNLIFQADGTGSRIDGNIIGSGGSFTKTSPQGLALHGTNTYSGATTITGGQLTLGATGSIANSSTIIVGASTTFSVSAVTGGYTLGAAQTLTGTGTVAGAMTVAGTLSPGASPGILSTGSQTWVDGGDYNFQMLDALGAAGTGFDQIAVTGTLNLSSLTASGFNINLWSLASTGPDVNGDALLFNNALTQSWAILTTTGGITGFDAADFTVNVGANNGTNGFSNTLGGGAFSVTADPNNLFLTFTAVPEPNVAALIGAFGGILLLRRQPPFPRPPVWPPALSTAFTQKANS